MIKNDDLRRMFYNAYGEGRGDIFCFFSPGRVNLIGEHIDYNGGFVFPGALSLGIYSALRYRDDRVIRLKSTNTINEVVINLDESIEYLDSDGWGNYPKGIIKHLLSKGYEIKGCDILYSGNLPDGAGLSSSAAIEVLTAYMVLYHNCKNNIDRVYLAKQCQYVENNFIKVNCGIMDQFSVAMGKKDNAILLDCSTLKYKYVPFKLESYSLVIMNTNKKRELSDSKYNERRRECESALEIIKEHKRIDNLCEAELDDIYNYIKDETLIKRARHVITENKRVLRAVEVLNKGDILEFARLMTESHMSLKKDYEVTGFELDTIVEEALNSKGCIGARMTGAGFGGCAIALVDNSRIESFKKRVSSCYTEKTGLVPGFYVSIIDDGVKFLG